MDKPKKAWLHKANDNYYTDEQFQLEIAHKPWLLKSYTSFVEETADCLIVEAGKKIIEKHAETFLRLRISELEDQLKESFETLEYYAADGQDNHVAQNLLLKLKGEK